MNKEALELAQTKVQKSLSQIFEVADVIPDRRPELVVGSFHNAIESSVYESNIDTGENLEVTYRGVGATILRASSVEASYGSSKFDNEDDVIRTSVQINRNSLSIYPGISAVRGEVLIDGKINSKLNETDVNRTVAVLGNVLNMVVGLSMEKDLV